MIQSELEDSIIKQNRCYSHPYVLLQEEEILFVKRTYKVPINAASHFPQRACLLSKPLWFTYLLGVIDFQKIKRKLN